MQISTKGILITSLIIAFQISCATPQQVQKASEPTVIQTNKPKEEVVAVIVEMLNEEGFKIDTINEKYGIITCKPNTMLSGALMKKLGEPGGDWVATNNKLLHTIEFSANVNSQGVIRFKTEVYDEKSPENIAGLIGQTNTKTTRALDTFRTLKLQDYYVNLITTRLNQ